MKVVACCSLLLAVLSACSAFQFQRKYRDGVTLYNHAGRTFTAYWDADIDQQTIYFAVNVSTTGWVGFGISPDGGMPRADVVIGWISRDGRQHFRVSRQPISLHTCRWTLMQSSDILKLCAHLWCAELMHFRLICSNLSFLDVVLAWERDLYRKFICNTWLYAKF